MNALSIPTKGIKDVSVLEKELAKGALYLAKQLCPDQYMEEATLVVVHMNCIWALIEQLKLRDIYIQKCMEDLGIPIPEPEHVTTWEDITSAMEKEANEMLRKVNHG